jgi:serine/threonine-protein kinase RsbW
MFQRAGWGVRGQGLLEETRHGSGNVRRHDLVDEATLAHVRRSLRHDLATAGVDSSIEFDCLVAVTEACTNALLHGHGDEVPRVSWRINGTTAFFTVEDYSRHRWVRLDSVDGSGDARVGGFGLDLMERLMDRVDITIEDDGTTVELIKRLR